MPEIERTSLKKRFCRKAKRIWKSLRKALPCPLSCGKGAKEDQPFPGKEPSPPVMSASNQTGNYLFVVDRLRHRGETMKHRPLPFANHSNGTPESDSSQLRGMNVRLFSARSLQSFYIGFISPESMVDPEGLDSCKIAFLPQCGRESRPAKCRGITCTYAKFSDY